MQRRSLLRILPAGLLGLSSVRSFAQKKGIVETLEHIPQTGYVTRKEFPSEKEAVEYVQDLIPELVKVEIVSLFDLETESIVSLRSGYRDAIRAQYRSNAQYIENAYCKIVHRETGEHFDVGVFNEQLLFKSPDATWAYLSNIRVNGKIVKRSKLEGSKYSNSISEYLTMPFNKR